METYKELEQKLIRLRDNLKTKISEVYGGMDCEVVIRKMQDKGRCKHLFIFQVMTPIGVNTFEVWKPHSGEDFYWSRV